MKLFIFTIFCTVSALANPQYWGYPGYTYSSPYYSGYSVNGYPYNYGYNNDHFVYKREAIAEPEAEAESNADAVPKAVSEAGAEADARILATYTTYGQSYSLTPFKKGFRGQPQVNTFMSRPGQFLGQQQRFPFYPRNTIQRQEIFPNKQQGSPFFPREFPSQLQRNPSFPRQEQFTSQKQASPFFPRERNPSFSRQEPFQNQQQESAFFQEQRNPSFPREEQFPKPEFRKQKPGRTSFPRVISSTSSRTVQFPNRKQGNRFSPIQRSPSFPMQRQGNPSFQRQEDQGNRFNPIKMLDQSNIDLVQQPGTFPQEFPIEQQGSGRSFPQQKNPSFPVSGKFPKEFPIQQHGSGRSFPQGNSLEDSMDLSLIKKMYPAVPEDLGVAPKQDLGNPSFPAQVQTPDQSQVQNFQQKVNQFFKRQQSV